MGSDNSTPVPSAPVVSLNIKALTWSTVINGTSYAVYELERSGKNQKNGTPIVNRQEQARHIRESAVKNYFVIAVNGVKNHPIQMDIHSVTFMS